MYLIILAITAYLLISTPSRSVEFKLCDLFTLAVITECIQVFVRDRGPSFIDVGIDTGSFYWVGSLANVETC
jgi:hypothetical protein